MDFQMDGNPVLPAILAKRDPALNAFSPFCPVTPLLPSYPGSFLVAPCLVDSIAAALVLFVAVGLVIAVVLSTLKAPRGGSADPSAAERSPLLNPSTGQPNSENLGAEETLRATSAKYPLTLRWAPAIAAICSVVCIVIDAAQTILQTGPSAIPQREHYAARIVSDFGQATAWILAAVATSFALLHPSRSQSKLSSFWTHSLWTVALATSIVQLNQWWSVLVLGSGTTGSVTPTDWTFAGACLAQTFILLVAGVAHFAITISDRRKLATPDVEAEAGAQSANGAKPKPAWANASKNMRRLVPFLQPKGFRLKLFLVGCFATLAVGRVVNVIVPMQYKMLVDALSTVPPGERDRYYAWGAVLTFCFLRYLQGGAGILGTLQNLLWTPVWMANTRRVSVEMLQHLHSLSLQFHINRKTGEVLRVMDRGTSSIGSLLSAILFNIGPVFLDIGLAAGWFIYLFDIATGVIVLVTMGLYILLTIVITEWRTKFRREMNQLDSASRARAVDSLLNFETVKYYNNEAYEVDRFEKSFIEYQEADWKSTTSLSFLNTAQNTVITLGLTAGCLLCASRVVAGELTIGDFIMFITYILQLYQPLNFLGTYYRMIQQNFIDMESMFELLEENATVKDLPGAPNLSVKDGSVEFENVTFGYDERVTALRNVSFSVPAKTTTALVGPSGSGKSTIFRLIFRFYEPTSGRILVDGQDISRVTQASLRRAIGVVPQDTVLFNNGIGYNIGYGDVTKSFDEVVEAAKRAQIHDRILTFPDQYETKVGERGLRLSGGEKQRVAIARTLLKDPKIILLDEATSALDNTTEVLIQRSLQELTSRRTTLIIAHRLSTIIHADCILVLKEGKIVERGTHDDLLERGKRLADLKRHKKEGLLGGVVEGLRGLVVGLEDGGVVDESVAKLETEGAGTYYHMWMREVEEEEQGKKEPAVALRRGNGAADVVDLDSRRGGGGGGRGGGRFH